MGDKDAQKRGGEKAVGVLNKLPEPTLGRDFESVAVRYSRKKVRGQADQLSGQLHSLGHGAIERKREKHRNEA